MSKLDMRIQSSLITASLVASALLVAAAPSPVAACGNAIEERVDYTVEYLVRSESYLRRRRHRLAVRWALRAYPGLRRVQGISRRTPSKVRRGLTVVALAALRSAGALDLGAGHRGKSALDRQRNVKWAIHSLKNLANLYPRNVRLRGHLGEALAASPKSHARARKILEKLAKRDLIVSAEGYAALARLRSAAGDSSGARAAITRCQRMAGRRFRAAVCQLPGRGRVAALSAFR
ncbi:MAG: hypothetical protein KC503_22085 [Myxococcales bacterium]|nr:hypothetical protein [Myxococcales bacterium]